MDTHNLSAPILVSLEATARSTSVTIIIPATLFTCVVVLTRIVTISTSIHNVRSTFRLSTVIEGVISVTILLLAFYQKVVLEIVFVFAFFVFFLVKLDPIILIDALRKPTSLTVAYPNTYTFA
jgi:hypothetical protein